MDYTEIIEREAEEFYSDISKDSSLKKQCFINGVNSKIAKQITEIEVVNGKISVLKSVFKEVAKNCNHSIFTDEIFENEIYQLEQLRDKLINELKIK